MFHQRRMSVKLTPQASETKEHAHWAVEPHSRAKIHQDLNRVALEGRTRKTPRRTSVCLEQGLTV